MRTSTFRQLLGPPACLLLAAVTAVACQSSVPHRAHVVDRAARPPAYFAQYGVSTHAYKPRRLNPSVDGSLYVRGMQWIVWDDRQATGRGIAHVNDCRPDCADGHYAQYRVTVRLARPRRLCGSRFFTTLRVKGSGYHTYAHRPAVACR